MPSSQSASCTHAVLAPGEELATGVVPAIAPPVPAAPAEPACPAVHTSALFELFPHAPTSRTAANINQTAIELIGHSMLEKGV